PHDVDLRTRLRLLHDLPRVSPEIVEDHLLGTGPVDPPSQDIAIAFEVHAEPVGQRSAESEAHHAFPHLGTRGEAIGKLLHRFDHLTRADGWLAGFEGRIDVPDPWEVSRPGLAGEKGELTSLGMAEQRGDGEIERIE